MSAYVGLDVLLTETPVSVRRGGKRIWRGKCASDPKVLADLIRTRAPDAGRRAGRIRNRSIVDLVLLYARDNGVPAICIDARHAKAALDMAANKTDANDADGLAHIAEVGFYRSRSAWKKGSDAHWMISAPCGADQSRFE